MSVKTFKTPIVHFVFFAKIFVSSHFSSSANYRAWHVYKPLFGSSVATCRLAYSEISLPRNEKRVDKVQIGR